MANLKKYLQQIFVKNKLKIKAFEQEIDYILTSKQDAYTIVNKILKPTLLNNSGSINLYKDDSIRLDELTTYLVSICYLKDHLENDREIIEINIEYYKLMEWLGTLIDKKLIIEESFIKQIEIKNNIVHFNNQTFKIHPIKIEKLTKNFYFSNAIRSSSKVKDLEIKALYKNEDNICDALVMKWIDKFSEADLANKNYRIRIKNSFYIGLDNAYKEKALSSSFIQHYQASGLQESQLIHVQDIFHSNHNIVQGILNLIALLETNEISHIYSRVLTYKHAVGISVSKKGDGFKIRYFDPDFQERNEEGEDLILPSIFLYLEDANNENLKLQLFVNNMTYFKQRRKNNLPVILKCYTREKLDEYIQIPDFFSLPKNNEEKQQLLLLGITTDDLGLVKNILNDSRNSSMSLEFYCNTQTPLTLAIRRNNFEIVKFLIEKGAKPDQADQFGIKPLTIVLQNNKIDLRIKKMFLSLLNSSYKI